MLCQPWATDVDTSMGLQWSCLCDLARSKFSNQTKPQILQLTPSNAKIWDYINRWSRRSDSHVSLKFPVLCHGGPQHGSLQVHSKRKHPNADLESQIPIMSATHYSHSCMIALTTRGSFSSSSSSPANWRKNT